MISHSDGDIEAGDAGEALLIRAQTDLNLRAACGH